MSQSTPPWSILAFEMTWWGTTHAPGNGSTLQTIARAFPGHPIKVYAEPGHITELARNPALTAAGGVTLHSVRVSRRFPGRPGIVSLRRLAREALTLHRALRTLKRGQPALIVMLSATSTAIFAASWLARLHGRHIAVQIGLHGNLHDAGTWRSRNPIARALDMTAAMSARHGGRLRYLVLEQSIKDALAARDPAAAALTDVLPLPINIAEFDGHIATPHPPPPLRVGFVGQATEAKGIDIFLRIATALGARYPGQISFHLVGRAMPGTDPNIFVPLAEPPTDTHLPRADFIARMASLHYVVLPFRPGYYDLAASGALIDALTWLKPVLAMPVGFVQALFASAGDIGDLCADEAALRAALERLVTVPDPDRYAAQVANLRAARAARLPDALAPSYRAMLTRAFGFLAGPG